MRSKVRSQRNFFFVKISIFSKEDLWKFMIFLRALLTFLCLNKKLFPTSSKNLSFISSKSHPKNWEEIFPEKENLFSAQKFQDFLYETSLQNSSKKPPILKEREKKPHNNNFKTISLPGVKWEGNILIKCTSWKWVWNVVRPLLFIVICSKSSLNPSS